MIVNYRTKTGKGKKHGPSDPRKLAEEHNKYKLYRQGKSLGSK